MRKRGSYFAPLNNKYKIAPTLWAPQQTTKIASSAGIARKLNRIWINPRVIKQGIAGGSLRSERGYTTFIAHTSSLSIIKLIFQSTRAGVSHRSMVDSHGASFPSTLAGFRHRYQVSIARFYSRLKQSIAQIIRKPIKHCSVFEGMPAWTSPSRQHRWLTI